MKKSNMPKFRLAALLFCILFLFGLGWPRWIWIPTLPPLPFPIWDEVVASLTRQALWLAAFC